MKNYLTLLLLLVGISESFSNTLYSQLCKFNPNWENHECLAPKEGIQQFNSDREYVQAHLKSVIAILRNTSLDYCQFDQYQSRLQLIEVLEAYRVAGNFPINYNWRSRVPVFIDAHNTHCAVGYLLKETGHEKLAKEIASNNNFAWVEDIKNPALLEWQKSSGFSLEELKLIQGAYDFYLPNALELPNKYEVPQQPKCMTLYFEKTKIFGFKDKENIWCYGEGKNGILNGVWKQNYAKGIPWIKGYYTNGKRTGQWEEYYPGTNQLCRTENWRDDELNGIRKRFNRSGELVEEILFKDGKAITKTNYDLKASLKWIRKPLDTGLMETEVYNFGGALIAEGKEKVHNPGNLLWFQNIELTALNTAAITSRNVVSPAQTSARLFNQIPLVKYKKEGLWTYYKDTNPNNEDGNQRNNVKSSLKNHYAHFGKTLLPAIQMFEEIKLKQDLNSIQVVYENDIVQHLYGYGDRDYVHLNIQYHDLIIPQIINIYGNKNRTPEMKPRVKEFGQYNKANQKIGNWKYINELDQIYKTEHYAKYRKKEEEEITMK